MSWYLAILAAMFLFALSSWGLSRLFGARTKVVAVGLPTIFRLRVGDTELRLGLLPLTSFTEPRGRGDDYDGPGSWKQIALAPRLLILLGPWLFTGVAALAFRGPDSIVNGFSQVFVTLDTAPLVRAVLALHTSFAVVFGITCAKMLVCNLPPALMSAAGELRRKPSVVVPIASILLFLWVAVRFAWGLYRALVT